MVYIGSYTIPFEKYSYVLKIQAMEAGPTGMREAMMIPELKKRFKGSIDDFMSQEWNFDPYNEHASAAVMMNLSEKQIYDIKFPDHPLTITRNTLQQWKKEVCN